MKKSLLALALVLLASNANATIVLTSNLNGATEPNATTFQVSATLSNSAGFQILQMTVTNTTSSSVGGFLTGLAFNLPAMPSNPIPDVPFQGSPANFDYINNVNTQPFGTLNAGWAVGGNFEGGGNPSKGIGVGQSGNFFLTFTGSSLTESNFLSSWSNNHFVARFKGLNNGGSNKVPAVTAVPEPSTLFMLGIAALLGSFCFKKS